MEKAYLQVKNAVTTFKLDYCCWLAPLTVGVYIIAYLNIMISLVSIIGIANESFSPTIMKIQELLMPDNITKPIPILAYCTDMSFNVLLLSATYRKDIVVARLFMHYNITTIIASTLFYSMLIPALDVLLTFTIIFSLLFQLYMLILVRSVIVKFKEDLAESKNGNIPSQITFSTLKREHAEEDYIEAVEEAGTSEEEANEEPKKEKERLETVEEHPNEVRIELNPETSKKD